MIVRTSQRFVDEVAAGSQHETLELGQYLRLLRAAFDDLARVQEEATDATADLALPQPRLSVRVDRVEHDAVLVVAQHCALHLFDDVLRRRKGVNKTLKSCTSYTCNISIKHASISDWF